MKTPDSRLCVTQDFMLRFEYLDQVTSLKSPAFLKAAILFLEASYYALLKYTFLSLSLSLSHSFSLTLSLSLSLSFSLLTIVTLLITSMTLE